MSLPLATRARPRRVHARGLDADVLEARRGELACIFRILERAGDAARPEQNLLADLLRHLAARDDIGDGETAAGLQDAECFLDAPYPCPLTG